MKEPTKEEHECNAYCDRHFIDGVVDGEKQARISAFEEMRDWAEKRMDEIANSNEGTMYELYVVDDMRKFAEAKIKEEREGKGAGK